MKITDKGIEFEESDFKKNPTPYKPENRAGGGQACPRCGDRMVARELDFICFECEVTVDKK